MMYRLKDRTKAGRPPELSKDMVYQIKKELSNSKQGWRTTKQVEELIIKKSGIKYHYTNIYRLILRKWEFKHKVPRKVHVLLHIWKRKRLSKKGYPNTCGFTTVATTTAGAGKDRFTIVSTDESFFFYYCLVRRV
jgi:hypothetical protein